MKTILWIAAITLTLASCGTARDAAAPPEDSPALALFFDSFTADWIRENPNQAISTRYLPDAELAELERHLTPLTRAWRLQRIAHAREGLEGLSRFDGEALSDRDRVSVAVMRAQLQTIVDGEAYLDFSYPLEQFNGPSVSLPNALTITHPVTTPRGAESYVTRLSEVDDRMREAIQEANDVATRGIVPPRFILQATITQMERFIAPPPADNPFVTTLVAKMADVAELPADRRAALAAEATRLVGQEVYPAWREAIALLRSQIPLSNDDAGITKFPGGAEAYTHDLRLFTTTDLTAEEIHAIGLREVERLESSMDTLLAQVGLREGTIAQRVAALRERLAYPDNAQGRRDIMSDIQGILADAQVRSAALFDLVPRTPVVAQPFPEFRWANAAANYTAPPPDGSRPGIFQMPLRRDQLTRFGKRSLVYHETVPGHHFQIALSVEDPDLPVFRRLRAFGGTSAVSEGWGLYAERLAAEQGWYDGDVEGLIGALDSQLFRARRLVVDTGLHTMGWTRQQAIDYGIEPSEVERYVVNAGQACSYMIGQLRIVELRERTRQALGDRFSLNEFHNVVLRLGSVMPLDVMESEVDRYIASKS